MSDEPITVGGPLIVDTDQLRVLATELGSLELDLRGILATTAALDRTVPLRSSWAAPWRHGPSTDDAWSPAPGERDLADAVRLLTAALRRAERLRESVELSAEGYALTEHTAERLAQELSARFGWAFGLVLPLVAVHLLPVVLGLGGALAAVIGLLPDRQRRALFAALPGWARKHSTALTDPRTVAFVRMLVMSVDDVGAGLLRLPPDLARALGDEGLGLAGLDTSAAAVAVLIGAGASLKGDEVSLAAAEPQAVRAPSGYEDRAARIPDGAAQVRIDRYRDEGRPDRFEVYIGGTHDFSLTAGDDPWDMTSNIDALAGAPSASLRAVEEAMDAAGIEPSSPVMFDGYSQGGLLAAQLAASGDYNVAGLYTLGAPAAQVEVPHDIPWVALEHTDDLVPALGGTWTTSEPILVRRELYVGVPVPTEVAFPAHQLDAYRQTARLADGSDDPRLTEALGRFTTLCGPATAVESTRYLARRLPDGG
ncbi:MAG TPA: hypothetical protein VGC18_15550 [Lacisediminihabitans sp.]|uniref:hypothetical protein n=1 Tax=Lacisediminihabitans sp. TaxID=2787631 RepID=UPI002EDA2170